jgi:hypothetical protein
MISIRRQCESNCMSTPSTDYTARLVPHRDGVVMPLEVDLILWQR